MSPGLRGCLHPSPQLWGHTLGALFPIAPWKPCRGEPQAPKLKHIPSSLSRGSGWFPPCRSLSSAKARINFPQQRCESSGRKRESNRNGRTAPALPSAPRPGIVLPGAVPGTALAPLQPLSSPAPAPREPGTTLLPARLGVRCPFSAPLRAADPACAPTCAAGQESISSALRTRSGGGQRWRTVVRGLSLRRHLLGLAAQSQPCPLIPAAASAVAPLQRAAALRVPAGGPRRLCCCRWGQGMEHRAGQCRLCPRPTGHPLLPGALLEAPLQRAGGPRANATDAEALLLALAFPQAGAELCHPWGCSRAMVGVGHTDSTPQPSSEPNTEVMRNVRRTESRAAPATAA